MTLEHEITFHSRPHDPAIETLVRERIERLPQFYDRVHNCRVVLDIHEVKVEVSVPNREAIVVHTPTSKDEVLATTVRESFNVAERRLRDLQDRRTDARR
jgi:ribosome-associated translation inhibitor RaiA